jgi:hypothetical protein
LAVSSVPREAVIGYGPPATGLVAVAVVLNSGLPLRTLALSPATNPL